MGVGQLLVLHEAGWCVHIDTKAKYSDMSTEQTDKPNETAYDSPIQDIAPGAEKNSVAVDIDKVSPNPDYIDRTFYYKTKGCDALILHHSLSCPQLVGANT